VQSKRGYRWGGWGERATNGGRLASMEALL
jgi:hypothetical protein